MERRLAAILSVDVVGYSRLMEQDEADTFERLKVLRKELFEPEIAQHHGRIFKLMGDGLLAEFGSVVDAVECAAVLQRAMADRNTSVSTARRIEARIGINLGDVIVEDDDRHGDGVNIANRLQALADPGGIAISGTAYDQVKTKVAVGFAFLGEQTVKNIAEPVRVYRILLNRTSAGRPAVARRNVALWRWAALTGVAALVVAVLAGAIGLTMWPREAPCLSATVQLLSAGQSIAVLPLDNLSGDPAQTPIVDGFADDLITELAQIPGLFVIARNSSFAYRGKACDIRRIAKELGVRNLIEGSVQRDGARMHINVQLIDGISGGHVAAEAFDGQFADHVELQSRIVRSIAQALSLRVNLSPEEAAARGETSVPAAYEAFLRGWDHYRQLTAEDFKRAIPEFEQAVALDQNYSRAYAALAMIYMRSATRHWTKLLGVSQDEAVSRARKYLALANEHPTTLSRQVAGWLDEWDNNMDAAIREFDGAIARDPADPWSYAYKAFVLNLDGRYAEAMTAIDEAIRRDPYGEVYFFYLVRGIAAFGLERLDEAVDILTTASRLNPDDQWSQLFLAATDLQRGRIREAWSAVARFNTLSLGLENPPMSTDWVKDVFWYRALAGRLAGVLRQSGIPERSQAWLSSDEIKRLLIGHTLASNDRESGVEYKASFSPDGVEIVSGDWGLKSGEKVRIDGKDYGQICADQTNNRCAMIYRNVRGTNEKKDEYVWVSVDQRVPFSQAD